MFLAVTGKIYSIFLYLEVKKRGKTFLLIFALTMTWGLAHIYSQRLPFKVYSVSDGLCQSQVFSIFQDSKGYMWFGTFYGVSRFNGTRFVNYSPEDGLIGNEVKAFVEDKFNNIWIGTTKGISMVNLKNLGQKKLKFCNYSEKQGLVENHVLSMIIDIKGNLWIGTWAGLSKIAFKEVFQNKELIFTNFTIRDGLSDNKINVIVEDQTGNIWFGTNQGISRLSADDLKNNKIIFRNYSLKDGLNDQVINSISEGEQGNIWFGTNSGGISKFRNGKFMNYEKKDGILENFITCSCKDRDGNIWFGTGLGISKLIIKNRRSENILFKNYSCLQGLSFDNIFSVFRDREENIWIGTNGGGVNLLSSERFVNYSSKDGLKSSVVDSIIQDKRGNIWLGTIGGGLSKLSPEGEIIGHLDRGSGLISDAIRVLYEDRKGNIWIGTNCGISLFNPYAKKMDFKNYNGFDDNFINDINGDDKGNIWVATNYGLSRLSNQGISSKKAFCSNFTVREGLADNLVTWIFKDRRKNLWIGTNLGLSYLDRNQKIPSKNMFKNYFLGKGEKKNRVTSIIEDRKGNIWLGTLGSGMGKFNPQNPGFTFFKTKQGLSHNVVYFLLEDDQGMIWVGTNRGVDKFNPEKGVFKNYSSKDGLLSDETNSGACCRDRNGNLWFGTVGGVSKYIPDKDIIHTSPPRVSIEKIQVKGRDFFFSDPEDIQFKYRNNQLTFIYTGLYFSNPDEIVYRYKLEGLNDKWSEMTHLRAITFTNLEPGEYMFQVKAAGREGIWSEKPAELKFSILPPFWQTWWFKLIIVIIVMVMGAALYIIRTRALKNRMERQQLQRELKLKTDFTAMLVHDLGNPLNSIVSYSDRLKENPNRDYIDKTTNIISKSAGNMLELIHDMLDISKFEAGKMELFKENEYLETVVKDTVVLITPQLQESGLELILNFESLPGIKFDSLRIKQVVHNLMSNAMKFSPEKGKIQIFLKRIAVENLYYQEFSIINEGLAIKPEQQTQLFDKYFQVKQKSTPIFKGTGLGLAISRFIIEAHGGIIGYKPEKNKRSRFFFRLPESD